MSSILDPLCCGFMNILMYELTTETAMHSSDKALHNVNKKMQKDFNVFVNLFSVCKSFDVRYDWYRRES